MKINKLGQITIFIIIGIILLFSTALIFYIKGKVAEVPEVDVEKYAKEVPVEAQSVKEFVDECIESVAIDALDFVGKGGGYIYVTPEEFDIDFSGVEPTEHEAFEIIPDSEWYMPYWHYMETPNDQLPPAFDSKKPYLNRMSGFDNTIENQIDNYINLNLNSDCLNDFGVFKKQGKKIEILGNVTTTTVVAENSVDVFVDYPMIIDDQRIEYFSARIPLRLKDVYDFADQLTATMAENKTLCRFVRNTVSIYGGLGKNDLPPISEQDFGSYTSKMWVEQDVKNMLETLLMKDSQYLKITNTEGFSEYNVPDDRIMQGLLNFMILDIPGDHSDMSVDIVYLNFWPVYLFTGQRGIITSTGSAQGGGMLSILPVREYKTPYDVSVPFLIEIIPPTPEGAPIKLKKLNNGKGFIFYFALEANMRNNECINESFTPLTRITPEGMPQLCNINQRNTGNISIETVDLMGNPAEDVVVTFESGGTGCLIGATQADESGKASLKEKFPCCGVGNLKFTGLNYLPYSMVYFTEYNKSDDMGKIQLTRTINKELKIRKFNLKKRPYTFEELRDNVRDGKYNVSEIWYLDSNAQPLSDDEKAIVMLEKIKENPLEEDFIQSAIITGDRTARLKLAPGDYKVTITLTKDIESLVVPDCEDCLCEKYSEGFLGIGAGCEEWTDIPGNQFNDTFFGGNTEINYTFTTNVYRDSTVIFNAVNFDLEGVPEDKRMILDIGVYGFFDEIVKEHQSRLAPKFINP